MQISEYSFQYLTEFRDDELTRENEYRRIAIERMLEDGPQTPSRPSVLQRVVRRIRAGRDSRRGTAAPRGTAQPNQLPTSS